MSYLEIAKDALNALPEPVLESACAGPRYEINELNEKSPPRRDAGEAQTLVARLLERREEFWGSRGYPEAPGDREALRAAFGRVDAAFLGGDLPGLQQASVDALHLMGRLAAALRPSGRGCPGCEFCDRTGRRRAAEPAEAVTPPAGAVLVFQDYHGRPCGREGAYLWTWVGASQWYYAARTPAPAVRPAAGRGIGEQ
jgi:hypothetical protein